MNSTLEQLRRPFHPSHVTWKPGSVNKEGTRALALAYADVRAYMNRLDEVCGMAWSVTYTPLGDRIVCHLTIEGVTRSSTGESDSQSERSEIGGTSAEAQAYKRACAMFGLGRYLYELPSVWVEMEDKKFTDKALTKLAGIVASHYQRVTKTTVDNVNGCSDQTDETELRSLFDSAGASLYGEQWPQIAKHNAERVSGGAISDPAQLTSQHIRTLLKGMEKLQGRRAA